MDIEAGMQAPNSEPDSANAEHREAAPSNEPAPNVPTFWVANPWNRSLPSLVKGYPKLAGHMELMPQKAIFRSFGALNARILLYLQAELQELESQLIKQEHADKEATGVGKKDMYANDWYWLKHSKADGDTKQLDLVEKIQTTLEKYNNALVQQSIIQGLEKPKASNMRTLQNFFGSGEMILPLIGEDHAIWGTLWNRDAHCKDLVVLCPRDKNHASPWFTSVVLRVVEAFRSRRWLKRFRRFKFSEEVDYESALLGLTMWTAGIVASLIPLVSITVLYLLDSTWKRLLAIGAFNLLISLCLGIFTRVRQAEMFAVSCALTAVQGVFVSTGAKI